MYFLLIVIILFLLYIAFFTPERRREREIRRVQKIFNTPISHELFDIDDPKNTTNSDDFVLYEGNVLSRNFALMSYESKKKLLEAKVNNKRNSPTDPEESGYIVMDGSPEHGRRYVFRAIRCYRHLELSGLATENEINKAYSERIKVVPQIDLELINYAHEFLLESSKIFLTMSKDAKKDFDNFFRIFNLFLKNKTEQGRIDFEEMDEELQLEFLDLEVGAHPKKY